MVNVQRISAEAALNHEWFREVPLPKSKEFMPTFPAQHAQDRYFPIYWNFIHHTLWVTLSVVNIFLNMIIRRLRRVMKSPNPLEKQRKEMQQGELASGGLFGQ